MGRKMYGPILVGGHAIGRFKLGGSGSPESNQFPVLAAGQFTVGTGEGRDYYGDDIDVLPLEGVSMTLFRFERPAGYVIPNADPNRDKAMYIKYVNRAENVAAATPISEYYGLNVETRNKYTMATGHAFYAYNRHEATGEITTMRGARIETRVDPAATAPTTFEGLRVDCYHAVNANTQSYGVVVKNTTDGTYTYPTAAFGVEKNVGCFANGIMFKSGAVNSGSGVNTGARWIIDETQDTVIGFHHGSPTDGTSGTWAGVAGKGSLLIDTSNGRLNINTNTKASPTWQYFSTLT